ncbi:bacillithiol biosynthesis cysteine-adding enzyme BshC [Longimicrobium sp.]|uniref:bacillithiol biosynthesis cysteine-adding enzyme BshC n=1 Tax=Longimicrobium sp. TaxID=2029185 RepID=UPI002B9FBBB0|nr:bacillithiol biosynthesis cysteine-adding enzyme BshC [Longimicrobium sp.]HSU16552.1 bacillithiol biosynthesis cysteine-adding enzyme BshC [Longimicrobium sp.]
MRPPAAEGTLSLHLHVAQIRGNRLVDDFLAGVPRAAAFYEGNPRDLSAWRAKLAEVRARFGRAEREHAAAALAPTSARAAGRLRRFVEEGGAMVTTGQQAGLFTGPLYTVHKILSAVRLAEALERALGVVVLPVFWAASEDHDFAEVNHAFAVDAAGELRRVAVAATAPVAVPMSEMRLGADVEARLDEFADVVSGDGDASPWLAQLRGAYRPGATIGAAFRDAIASLFADFDLFVTDAADPALKAASAHVLLAELEHAAEHERLVAEQTAALAAAGYPSQVTLVEEATNVFWHGPAGRERLYREGGGFVAKDARRHFSLDDLRAVVAADPRALSPNVFLRPVVESSVFPTLSYVGGPAETAYFAQVRPLFAAFGIRAPVVFPRFGASIVPTEIAEARERLAITDDELRLPGHELWDRVARRHMPAELWARMDALRRALVEGWGSVIDVAEGIDANLRDAVGGRRNRALLEAAKAERTVIRHFKQRNPQMEADARRVRNHLRPNGVPQERVLTVFQYLARDPSLLRRLADGMHVELAPEAEPAAAGD